MFIKLAFIRLAALFTLLLSLGAYAAQSNKDLPIFDNAALDLLLKSDAKGVVIYAWSPRMPYSIDGYKSVKKICDEMGLQFEPVLDPTIPSELAQSMVRENGFSDRSLRLMASSELSDRGVMVHYPTLIMIKKGRFVSSVIPGLLTEKKYREVIAYLLKKERS